MARKSVSNEDILELLQESMQMTSDGFVRLEGRMDGLEVRMDNLENRMDNLENRMDNLENRMDNLEGQLHTINERLKKMESYLHMTQEDVREALLLIGGLERKLKLSNEERKLAAITLGHIVSWAEEVSKELNVPLKIA